MYIYQFSIHAFEIFVLYMYTYTYSINAFENCVLFTTVCMHICYYIVYVQLIMSYSGVKQLYSLLFLYLVPFCFLIIFNLQYFIIFLLSDTFYIYIVLYILLNF